MTLSMVPTAEELFGAARRQILLQHDGLRPHLLAALKAARAAAAGSMEAARDLPALVILLLAELDSHMSYEESVLPRLFAASGAGGQGEVATLRREHRRQRAEFTTMLELAKTEHDPADLALSFQCLVADVLLDMAEEEDRLAHETIRAENPTWAH